MRGALAKAISNGLMDQPIHIHSHGGRVHLIQSGELKLDVAFLGVSACDRLRQCQRRAWPVAGAGPWAMPWWMPSSPTA